MSAVSHAAPPLLYKYFSPCRAQFLANGLVRYSPLGAFNDPFEGAPDITSLATDADAEIIIARGLDDEIIQSYESLPASMRESIGFEDWTRLMENQFSAKGPKGFNHIPGLIAKARLEISKKLDEVFGAFCLSETPDDLLMWSHYASSHTGFVVAFDSRNPYFNGEWEAKDKSLGLRPVQYREERPSGSLTELGRNELALVKSCHWKYEREWRTFRLLKDATRTDFGEPFDNHLFAIPGSALREVILGARITRPKQLEIRSLISANSTLKHVVVKRSIPHESKFLLRIVSEDI